MFIDQIAEPNQMEKYLSPWDLYKGVQENSFQSWIKTNADS